MMRSFWNIFSNKREETKEEKLKRENDAMDKKITQKELEIKMIKSKIQQRKQTRFNRRMKKKKATINEVEIDGIFSKSTER